MNLTERDKWLELCVHPGGFRCPHCGSHRCLVNAPTRPVSVTLTCEKCLRVYVAPNPVMLHRVTEAMLLHTCALVCVVYDRPLTTLFEGGGCSPLAVQAKRQIYAEARKLGVYVSRIAHIFGKGRDEVYRILDTPSAVATDALWMRALVERQTEQKASQRRRNNARKSGAQQMGATA